MTMSLQHKRYLSAITTVATFAVLGPPIGAVTLSLVLPLFILTTAMTGNAEPVATRLLGAIGMAPPAIIASFGVGIMPAAVTGLFVALHRTISGNPDAWRIMGYATAVWAGYVFLGPARDALEMALLWPVHAVPAVICAWIAARFWGEVS